MTKVLFPLLGNLGALIRFIAARLKQNSKALRWKWDTRVYGLFNRCWYERYPSWLNRIRKRKFQDFIMVVIISVGYKGLAFMTLFPLKRQSIAELNALKISGGHSL